MGINQEQRRKTGVPQLRVFRGEDAGESGHHDPSDAARQARLKWARCEVYWAGQNRAARLSARLVA